MTLDEAIKCTEKLAKEFKLDVEISITKYAKENLNRLADEYEQLASWLKELKERREENEQLKRILKVAISNIYKKCSCENSDCDICEIETTCDYDNRFTWKLEKEAFDLIYKRGDKK